ncbi:dihydrofolate reductase [Jiulongibacter sp. NS-SX5]|uniref:dihydrofolate reductase n=1 Tax=Jiulongibacter sp. NS-SX5 TaxID=3463854 RepID=UPI0040588E8D
MPQNNISLIIAIAENNAIGKDNSLIWRLSDDLKNFKRITSGHSIIMGRKTFDSIGRPLPKRTNIVITRKEDLVIEGCEVVHSLKQAFELAKDHEGHEEIFVIGGANIYEQALPFVSKVYLTKVFASPEADAFFDISLFNDWKIIDSQFYSKDEKNEYDFEIMTLERLQD